jgi:hypothetical protein
MKFFTYLFAIVCILNLFYSCKKYENGPLISFRSANKKICNNSSKEWQLESFSFGGGDSTLLFIDSCGNSFDFIYGSGNSNPLFIRGGKFYGSWETSNNDELIIDINQQVYGPTGSSIGIGPISPSVKSTWKILRLTTKQFWLETTLGSTTYKMKLKN